MNSVQKKPMSENLKYKIDNEKNKIISEQGRKLEKIIITKIPKEIINMPYSKYLEFKYEALSDESATNVEDTMYHFDKIRDKVKNGIATNKEKEIYESIKSYGKSK